MAVAWDNRSKGGGLGAAKPRRDVERAHAAFGRAPRRPGGADSTCKSQLLRNPLPARGRLGRRRRSMACVYGNRWNGGGLRPSRRRFAGRAGSSG